MKRIFQNTLAALNKKEKQKMFLLAAADVAISIMDIGLLALLLIVVQKYTQGAAIPFKLSYLLVLFIAKNLGGYYVQQAKYHFVYRVAARLSELNLLQYLEGNYQNYAGTDSSVHIRKISQQPVEFGHYVLSGFQQMFSETVMVLLAITAIIWYDAELFGFLCLVMVPPLLLLSLYFKRKLNTVRKNVKISSERSLQYLKEALAGYVESNVYDKKDFFTDRYSDKQQALNKYLASLQAAQALPPRLMETFAVVGLLFLIMLNKTVIAFFGAAYKIIPGLVKIMNLNGQIKTYAFAAEGLVYKSKKQIKSDPIHSIEIKDLYYKQVLSNFNLCARRGEMIGLSGISGKGKTTLLNLFLGFLEAEQGEIFINNKPTTAVERQHFWNNISYVKQQGFLVHDTVSTNISLSTQHDETRLQQAIEHAGISHLPDDLITENGKNISGGQRQRIAFARALYKDADVILLDEPFNELDEAAENNLLQNLQNLQQQGKIIILITHNKNSLSFCTRTVSI